MTRSDLVLLLRTIVATVLLSTATATSATLYRWVDDTGNVTFSNVPPPPGARVREILTIEEDRAPTRSEIRTRQILEEAERERRALETGDSTALLEKAAGSYAAPDAQATPTDPFVPFTNPRNVESRANDTPGSAQRRPSGATRDPCLVSADPRCYELNASSYDPYLGYTPNPADMAAPPLGAPADAVSARDLNTTVGTSRSTQIQPVPAVPRLTGLPPGTPVRPLSRAGAR